ncbi:MAG: undecaprenyl-diphosphate phosphatase [Actinomycetota bacterium]
MSVLRAIVLGIVQGVTEFAPISSSGHLIVVPWLLGWQPLRDPDLAKTFDVALHLGTLAGAATYFRADLRRYGAALLRSLDARRIDGTDARVAWAIVFGTIPGALVGATFEGFIEDRLGAPALVAAMLVVFGVALVVVDRASAQRETIDGITVRRGLLLGLAQALALQPGVSRSGVTITAARAMGLDRPTAARISFLLSLPIIAGAGLWKGLGLVGTGLPAGMVAPFVAGMLASAVSGFAVIWFLLAYLRRHAFTAFLWYRIGAAVVILAALGLGRPTG